LACSLMAEKKGGVVAYGLKTSLSVNMVRKLVLHSEHCFLQYECSFVASIRWEGFSCLDNLQNSLMGTSGYL